MEAPKVRKSRSNFTDPTDGGHVWFYRDCSIAPVLNKKRRLNAVLDVLDSIDMSGNSLTKCLELGSDGIERSPMVWWVLWSLKTSFSDTETVTSISFKVYITDLFVRFGEFLHQVVVGRRAAAVRSRRNWIREELSSRLHTCLRRDHVPPSIFLSCDLAITAGGSGIKTIPCETDRQFQDAWLSFFVGDRGAVDVDEFVNEVASKVKCGEIRRLRAAWRLTCSNM